MPHAVSDDTVLDILPELPDEAPAADHETDYVRNDPHALSALPDMVSTRPEQTTLTPPPASEPLRLVGEVFKTYIITERGSELCLIDKHAAHERILFEQLARDYGSVPSQMLLVPVQVNLTAAEKQAVLQNLDLLTDAGIEAEDFGGSTVVVRAVPADVPVDDVEDMIVELAAKLATADATPCVKRPSGCCIPSPAARPSKRGTARTPPRCSRWPSASWTARSRRSARTGGPAY